MLGPVRIKDLSPEALSRLIQRNRLSLQSVKGKVEEILQAVKLKGDGAVVEYAKLYDRVELAAEELQVKPFEVAEAYEKVGERMLRAIKKAASNIQEIHRKQLPKSRVLKKTAGVYVRQVFRPLGTVGLYVPGGQAAYPSTALMLALPAKVAGVRRLVACTPPAPDGRINPATLVALDVAGVGEIFKVGGVQAIGALAYGTQTIPKVDKILGPGNIYVTAAKMLVYGEVGIDFLAGPTELVVFADSSVDAELVAVDLISQAEHDSFAVPILVTTDEGLATEVGKKLRTYASQGPRKAVVEEALKRSGALLLADSPAQATEFINAFAPEHLEVFCRNPEKFVSMITNAGSISLGAFTPTPAVDYAAGSNHVLPTGGAARFSSGLWVYDFMKAVNVEYLTSRGLEELRETVEAFSEAEGLPAHRLAVEKRYDRRKGGRRR